MVTMCTGVLSQFPVVKMSWEEKSQKKNLVFWPTFVVWSISSDTLVPWSPWSLGAQAAYLSFQWSKWAWEKNLRKNQVFWPIFISWSISSDTLVPWSPWSPSAQATYLSFQGSKWTGGKNLRKNLKIWPTFIFWSISSDTLVAWLPQVDRHTGGLSVLINFRFLIWFSSDTLVSWSPGVTSTQVAYLIFRWSK